MSASGCSTRRRGIRQPGVRGRHSDDQERVAQLFDACPAVRLLAAEAGRLTLVVHHQEPLVRPDDVLSALTQLEPEFAPSEVPILTRLTQGILDLDTGAIAEPSV